MTRETRIGLVVGLAFIVLFGVVLSELGPSDEVPESKVDRTPGGFYARAPVIPPPQPRAQREPVPLIARQGPATGSAQQPPRRQQPPPVAGSGRTPPTGTPRRPVLRTPTRPPSRGESREMTPEEFARTYGAGAGAGRRQHARTYVTRRGDNLTAIARKFYRTPSRKAVMKIFKANRNVLETPDSLGVGVKIVIPN